MNPYLQLIGLSALPISELRGGIPFGILVLKLPLWQVLLICIIANAVAGILVYELLGQVLDLFLRNGWIRKTYQRYVGRAQKKYHEDIQKYGTPALSIFIGIPLPMSGVWTGAALARAAGFDRRYFYISAIAGVCIAGAIVTAVVVSGSTVFALFIR